jgi:ribosome-associated protein
MAKKTVKKAPAKKAAAKKTSGKKPAPKKAPSKKAKAPKKVESKIAKAKTQTAKPSKAKSDVNDKLANAVIEGIQKVKGKNISKLDLRNIGNRVCDYFIICQAESNTQVNAIANAVEEVVKQKTGERPYRKEGFENAEWILVDFVTVVVHIFQTQTRNFYNLESLWADANVTEIDFE